MASDSCPTKFLPDNPVEQDDFGSHERIAKALLDLICGDNSGSVNAVALEGTWGSGKSTVIKILDRLSRRRDNDECKADVAIFVYDTWAYQGDSLRRSFLERLIDFLIQKQWLSENKWLEEKELLARRREEATITTTPLLTGWGKTLAFSLGLVPLGVALATMGGSVMLLCRQIGVVLTGLPMGIGILAAGWNSIQGRRRKAKARDGAGKTSQARQVDDTGKMSQAAQVDDTGKTSQAAQGDKVGKTSQARPGGNDDWIGLFVQKTREIQRTATTRTPEPTSVEFSQKFQELLQEALTESKRRIVIVMDNLDRLPPDDALQAWATMRTFSEAEIGNWQKQLLLVVPYSPKALSRMWKGSEEESTRTAQAFISKTFQVRFHVPPPVLSDWSGFMKHQLEEAFPDHKGTPEIETIVRLFRLKGIPEDRSLTPRDIKLFVNRLGAIHSEWGDEIPLPVQAAYVLYEDELDETKGRALSEELAREEFVDARIKAILQEKEWQKYFAALYFNVPPEKALQVLVGQQIEKALAEGDARTIVEYKDIPGLEHVIGEILDRKLAPWTDSQPEFLLRVPLALEEIADNAEPWNQMWDLLCREVMELSNPLKQFGPSEARGLKILLKRYQETAFAQQVIHILEQRLAVIAKGAAGKDKKKSEEIQAWTQGTYDVVVALRGMGFESVVLRHFRIRSDAATYLEIMLALAKEDPTDDVVRYFVPSAQGEEIIEELEKSVRQRDVPEHWGKAVGIMTQVGPQWPFDELVAVIDEVTNSPQPVLSPQQWMETLQALWHISALKDANGQAESMLQTMSTDGRIFHYLYTSHEDKIWGAVAWNLMSLLRWNPKGEHRRSWQRSNAGVQTYNNIIQRPDNYGELLSVFSDVVARYLDFGFLLTTYHQYPNTRKWIGAVIQEILENDPQFLTPAVVVEKYRIFKELPPALQGKVLQQLGEGLVVELKNRRFMAEYADLYYDILKLVEPPSSSFLEFVKGGLRSVDKDRWMEALDKRDSLWKLLYTVLDRGETLKLDQEFSDALIGWTQSLLERGDELPEGAVSIYSRLPQCLDSDSGGAITFWRTLRDIVVNKADQDLSAVFQVFGEGLIESGVLSEKADEITRMLFPEIAEGEVEVEVRWMLDVVEKDSEFIGKVETPSLSDFLVRLKKLSTKLSDDSEELRARVSETIRRLEVEIENRDWGDER